MKRIGLRLAEIRIGNIRELFQNRVLAHAHVPAKRPFLPGRGVTHTLRDMIVFRERETLVRVPGIRPLIRGSAVPGHAHRDLGQRITFKCGKRLRFLRGVRDLSGDQESRGVAHAFRLRER